MKLYKKAAFRSFQTAFRLALPFLPYRDPVLLKSCRQLPEILKKEKIQSALLITDNGIVENGLTRSAEQALKKENIPYIVYSKTRPNPTINNVEEALALYRANKCDCLIAIGGGSVIDCAKAVGARAVYPGKTISQMKGVLRVLRRLPVMIAVPTTAGTGSETTLAAVITDEVTHHKYALMSFALIPHYAVLDPELTLSLPPFLTATTGMDALTHAVEACIGRSTTTQTRALALEAVRLVFENLETAYHNGQDWNARANMLKASYMAGAAFSKSYVGYIHAIAHSLGGQYGIPHGLANAVIMPYVLDEYGACIQDKLYELALYSGICSPSDTAREGARKFIRAIREMNKTMNIPEKLPGIHKRDIPKMAFYAEREANPLYPVPKLLTRQELEMLYYKVAEQETERIIMNRFPKKYKRVVA